MSGSYFPWEDDDSHHISRGGWTAPVRYNRLHFAIDLEAIREAITRRQLRDGLTLRELSQELRISRMTLWRLMGGRRIEATTLGRIIAGLDLDDGSVVRRVDATGQAPPRLNLG